MSETPPIGLSTAIWNSRHWLVGIHILFMVVLFFLYALMSLGFYLFLHHGHVLAGTWELMKHYWYAPLVVFSIVAILALLISRQEPIDPTRSEPAGQDYRACRAQFEALCITAGLPRVPELYIVDHDSINALIWKNKDDNFRLYVTKGACEKLDKSSLDVVMAQQLGHLINGDPFIYPFMVTYIDLVCAITLEFITGLLGGMTSSEDHNFQMSNSNSIGSEISRNTNLGDEKAFPFLSVLFVFPALWLAFRRYGESYGQMCEYRADLFAIRLTKTAKGLLEALDAVKPTDRLFAFSDGWRELAFVNPDPALTLQWHREKDERLLKLRAAVGLAAFENGLDLNKFSQKP